jgi:hypothetical protein
MNKLVLAVLAMVIPSFTVIPSAQADFQGDVIREAARRRRDPRKDFAGIERVRGLQELDLETELTAAETSRIRSSLVEAYAASDRLQRQLPELFTALELREGRPTNLFFYLGIGVGAGLGFSGNVAVFFGHSRATGELAVYPAVILRGQLFDVGYDVHVGIGALDGRPRGARGGLLLGGAYVAGAGIGWGRSESGGREVWVELKAGLGVQFGPYLELIL